MSEPRESPSTKKEITRNSYRSRDEWLIARRKGIGASEAAAIVGMSPWMTATELWELKTGQRAETDKSSDKFVSQGVRLEPVLRELFKVTHPEYIVDYHAYDIIFQPEIPWLFATLDGELTSSAKRHGILEIKTATPTGRAGWAKWDGKIPQNYYLQLIHQLLATGYDFAVLYAALFSNDGNIFIREYWLERFDCEEDMAWLLEREGAFWKSVNTKTMPPLSITF